MCNNVKYKNKIDNSDVSLQYGDDSNEQRNKKR